MRAFIFELKGTPAEYEAGLNRAIAMGWLVLHESGTYVCSTEAGAVLFARHPMTQYFYGREPVKDGLRSTQQQSADSIMSPPNAERSKPRQISTLQLLRTLYLLCRAFCKAGKPTLACMRLISYAPASCSRAAQWSRQNWR
jgi:hypothetical protein